MGNKFLSDGDIHLFDWDCSKRNIGIKRATFDESILAMNHGVNVESSLLLNIHKSHKNLIPKQIIYNDPTTICTFPDGEKVVVKCGEGEKYVKEVGVMACIVKKLYGNRSEFLRDVEAGYDQKEAKNKK
jgi:hypothetical protein